MTKVERNFDSYVFMTWLNQYLQMREGRSNTVATITGDDTEEYHSNTDGLSQPHQLKDKSRIQQC